MSDEEPENEQPQHIVDPSEEDLKYIKEELRIRSTPCGMRRND